MQGVHICLFPHLYDWLIIFLTHAEIILRGYVRPVAVLQTALAEEGADAPEEMRILALTHV